MGMAQQKLNRELPYGPVFQGSGDPDPKDAGVKYYQHGLYFTANGDLAKDSVHNKARLELIEEMEGVNPSEPPAQMQAPDRAPINPEVVAKLGDKTDEEVFVYARNLTVALTKKKTAFDYEPSVEAREDNIRFIAQYTS